MLIEKIKELGYYKEFKDNVDNIGLNSFEWVEEHETSLLGCFVWEDSKEGHDFWHEIHDMLENLKQYNFNKLINE